MKYGLICVVFLCHILLAPGAPRRQERMAGGFPVTSDKYPWVVALAAYYTVTQPEIWGYSTAYIREELGDEWLDDYRDCTGSIIDVYGTVLTASHCLRKQVKQVKSEEFNLNVTLELQSVKVKWGSPLSIMVDKDDSRIETVTDLSRLHYHPESYEVHGNSSKLYIDIALIYLKTFNKRNPINCSSNDTVRPITMSKVYPEVRNPTNGSVAGFGCQPITDENNWIMGFDTNPNLMEHVVKYRGRLEESYREQIFYNSSVNTSRFYATAEVYSERTPMNWTSMVDYSGSCTGDSGGPYMENESGETILRGIGLSHVRPFCREEVCVRANESSTYGDLNYPKIRDWITYMIRVRYFDMGVESRTIPQTC